MNPDEPTTTPPAPAPDGGGLPPSTPPAEPAGPGAPADPGTPQAPAQ